MRSGEVRSADDEVWKNGFRAAMVIELKERV